MEKDLRVFVKVVKTKDGKEFKKYSAIDKKGQFMEVKFVDGSAKPTEPGYFMIKFNDEDVNFKNGKFTKENGEVIQTSVLWINKIISFVRDEAYEKEVAERKAQEKNDRL